MIKLLRVTWVGMLLVLWASCLEVYLSRPELDADAIVAFLCAIMVALTTVLAWSTTDRRRGDF